MKREETRKMLGFSLQHARDAGVQRDAVLEMVNETYETMKDYNEPISTCSPGAYVLVATVSETDRCSYGIILSRTTDKRLPLLFPNEALAVEGADTLAAMEGLVGRTSGGTLQVVSTGNAVSISCWPALDWLKFTTEDP